MLSSVDFSRARLLLPSQLLRTSTSHPSAHCVSRLLIPSQLLPTVEALRSSRLPRGSPRAARLLAEESLLVWNGSAPAPRHTFERLLLLDWRPPYAGPEKRGRALPLHRTRQRWRAASTRRPFQLISHD